MQRRQVVHGGLASLAIVTLLLTTPGLPGRPGGVAWAQATDPPDRVGRLSYLHGPVSFAPAGVNQWAHATLNYPLTTGSALWTDEGGRAELHIGSTAIRMDQLTELHLLGLDDQAVQLRIAQGTIDIGLRHLDPDEHFEVATPSASVLLLSTGHYRIQITEDGTRLTVRRGALEVATSAGSFSIHAGQTVLVAELGAQLITNPAPSAFDQWALAREAEDAHASQAAGAYLPPAMTGYEDLGRHGTWRVVAGYGPAWFPPVEAGWAPYRFGRWVWVAPWGWTWIDGAPWGFAPFHYGRWVLIVGLWAWIPGPVTVRPVFAPALVVFVIIGDVVAWFPLAPHEAYVPPYHASPGYRRRININITIINITYVYRASWATGVHKQTFLHAGPIQKHLVSILGTRADVTPGVPLQPEVHNLLGQPRGGLHASRPPAIVEQRPVIVRRTPPAPPAPPINPVNAPPRKVPVRPVTELRPINTAPPAVPAPQPVRTPGAVRPGAPLPTPTPPPQGGVPTPRVERPGGPLPHPPQPAPQPALPAPQPQPAPQPVLPAPQVAPTPPRNRPAVRPPAHRPGGLARPICDERSPQYDPRQCPERKGKR